MREKGFSLIESMMALALLAMVVYGFMSFTSGQAKRQAQAVEKEDILEMRAALVRSLDYPGFCDCNFTGQPFPSPGQHVPLPALRLYQKNCQGQVGTVIETGSKAIFGVQGRAKVKSIELVGYLATPGNMNVAGLLVDFDNEGGSFHPVVIPGIFVYNDAKHGNGSVIYGCRPPPET